MNDYIKKHQSKVFAIIFIISLLCTGIFYEYYSCAFSMSFGILLFFVIKSEKQFIWRWNLTSTAVLFMTGLYLFSTLWAVDSGMAFVGFLKFLPVLFFLMLLMQKKDNAENLFSVFPYIVTVLVVLSVVAMYIPAFESKFSVAGRLAGFFQYPNTFALLLLVAELFIIGKNKLKMREYITLIVLIVALLMTGSRTVFVLALLANAVLILFHKNKKVRVGGIVGLILLVIGVIIFAIAFDGAGVITRFLRFSLTESTFVGRILYFVDAIPTIVKSPFGLGYMGYYYIQQSIQTGLYSVMFIHNDWLQILLDVGWIPCVLFITAIIKTLVNKKISFEKKVILMTMFLHSCFDFNLQFIAMFFLLVLLLDYEAGKEIVIKKKLFGMKCVAVAAACVSLYCGVSLLLTQLGKYETSLKMYPWNTQAQTNLLTQIDDLEEAEMIADRILERNEYVTLAYSVKARVAYSKGDFGKLITYKNTLLEKAPFQYDEYEEYAYMLINGISLYTKAGDTQSADVCQDELLALPEKLEQAEEHVSKLGKKIKDQPITELPEDIKTYISRLESAR